MNRLTSEITCSASFQKQPLLSQEPQASDGKAAFLTNEFGGFIYENVTDEETGETVRVPKQNPDCSPALEADYEARAARDEWHIVGLNGRHYVRVDGTVSPGDYITAHNGIGTKAAEGWKVLKLTALYSSEKRVRHCNCGYQIGSQYQDHLLSFLSGGYDPVFYTE